MFSLPFASEEASIPDAYTPLDTSLVMLDRWCFTVKTWWLDVNVFDGISPFVFSGECGWNYNNERYTRPPSPGSPANENFLGMGWQIDNFEFFSGGALVGIVNLFTSRFSNSTLAGFGYQNAGGVHKPYLQIVAGNCSTQRSGTSAVICTVDGLSVPVGDSAPFINTGTIDLSPFTYWP